MKKIVVIGNLTEADNETVEKINKFALENDTEVEWRKPDHDNQNGIEEVYAPSLPERPQLIVPYLARPDFDIAAYALRDIIEQGQKRQSKYARPATEKELSMPNLGRNNPCNCGSGKKIKKCCGYL